ncbi:uncharacterized protein LOC107606946 [Arachis ipaensis]|uniref:uncharacterized protein LOC107606946 n=1 Tax=Arachis ipaensis TaxID=130454 RepID=UPI000A2B8C16|nr:uncharacterized protein LOC107606946 [Arachis ipaensis]
MDHHAKFARQRRMNLLSNKRRQVNELMSTSGPKNADPNIQIYEPPQNNMGVPEHSPATVGAVQGSSPCNVSKIRGKHITRSKVTLQPFLRISCSDQIPKHVANSPSSQSTNCHLPEASDVQVQVSDASATEPGITLNDYEFFMFGQLGYPCKVVFFCGVNMWMHERLAKGGANNTVLFSICCMRGKMTLPLLPVLPPLLVLLLDGDDERVVHYQKHIRAFNGMFSFTSMAGKIQYTLNKGSAPPIHSYQHNSIDQIIVADLSNILDSHNSLAKSFRYARQRFAEDSTTLLQLRLIKNRNTDGRKYNLPSASEVAALIIGDFDTENLARDVIIQTRSNQLKSIDVNHPQYLALQYPLLFLYGEDGFRSDILISEERSKQNIHKQKTISMREFLSFRIQMTAHESQVLLKSRRLFQQFLVDSYTVVEAKRLQYHKYHQNKFCSHQLQGLHECLIHGETQAARIGKRVILPSSFVGGPRYMYNNCKDAFAMCRYAGYPSYFITIICNPEWNEIKECVAKYSLKPSDRPDIISRVFKIKLDALLKDLKDGSIFGKPKAIIYTVELQKRGLPHCHILLFIQPNEKPRSSDDIDHHISAEIPDEHMKNYTD